MAFVTIRIKGSEGYTRVALGKERMVLGRSSETDLPIKHTSISREHCVFIRSGDEWFIEDMGSSNGTWLGKEKITGKERLHERAVIKAGRSRLTFHQGSIDEPEAAIDLGSHDDDDEDGEGEGDSEGAHHDEPKDAMRCNGCGIWLSRAHHRTGEKLTCPRCHHSNTVPSA